MSAEYGSFALALLCALSLLGALMPCLSIGSKTKQEWAHSLPMLQWLMASFAMLLLIESFIALDYTVYSVASHAHNSTPLLYRITASWGHHEGSMLLWVWLLTSYSALLRHFQPKQASYGTMFVSGMSLMTLMLSLFLLLTSNPFSRIFPPPQNGEGLNPVLQDIALAIHPPLLYVGYVGFVAVGILAWSMSRLHPITTKDWKYLQAVTALAWGFLTLGIGLGSWWAYRELGWGGFWFWDPVENVSLLPWLAGVALLHGLSLSIKRGTGGRWCLAIAATALLSSLLGTFLVRSGMLTSVHAFAHDPERGLFILLIIASWCVILFSRILTRQDSPTKATKPSPLISRESGLMMQHVLMVTAWLTMMLGIAFPLYMEWQESSVTVGAAYYNSIFLPLSCIAALLAAFSPQLRWHTGKLASPKPLLLAFALVSAALALTYGLLYPNNITHSAIILTASFLLMSHIPSPRTSPKVSWPVIIGHSAFALLLLGIIASVSHRTEINHLVTTDAQTSLNQDWNIQCSALQSGQHEDYHRLFTSCTLHHIVSGKTLTLTPERRNYTAQQSNSFEVAQHSTLACDIQLVLGEIDANAKTFAVRFYIQPFILLIWFAFTLCAAASFGVFWRAVKKT